MPGAGAHAQTHYNATQVLIFACKLGTNRNIKTCVLRLAAVFSALRIFRWCSFYYMLLSRVELNIN